MYGKLCSVFLIHPYLGIHRKEGMYEINFKTLEDLSSFLSN